MKQTSNSGLKLSEYNKRVCADLQAFLNYKRETSVDYGSRLLEPFVVTGFSDNDNKTIFVKFENHDVKPTEHYWVNKKEFSDFLRGEKKLGASLNIDKQYIDDGHIVFELRLNRNGMKSSTVHDASKFKDLVIEHQNGNLYKVFDVQVKLKKEHEIENAIKLFVSEIDSAEQFIQKQVVVKDNMEATKGPGMTIVLSGPNTQEEFLKKGDAIRALKIERKNTVNEIYLWLQTVVLKQTKVDTVQLRDEFAKKFK